MATGRGGGGVAGALSDALRAQGGGAPAGGAGVSHAGAAGGVGAQVAAEAALPLGKKPRGGDTTASAAWLGRD